MKSRDPDPESTTLAGNITIREYREMVRLKNQKGIAELVQKRFKERYLDPVLVSPQPHGFAMLAVCCLMVEALESFRQGRARTNNGSEAFCSFFQAHEEFRELRPVAHDFYRAVRCGILHQAETTDGWRVDRNPGCLFETNGDVSWISASEFAQRLEKVLRTYCESLKALDWHNPVWTKARAKLQSICKNSKVKDLSSLC